MSHKNFRGGWAWGSYDVGRFFFPISQGATSRTICALDSPSFPRSRETLSNEFDRELGREERQSPSVPRRTDIIYQAQVQSAVACCMHHSTYTFGGGEGPATVCTSVNDLGREGEESAWECPLRFVGGSSGLECHRGRGQSGGRSTLRHPNLLSTHTLLPGLCVSFPDLLTIHTATVIVHDTADKSHTPT